ncbi:hypothetical protein CEXT_14641 [Caerostris extrusa]|uniref:Uncharacterized protein n=1 Tax=Caerostris extrusa TaxID=172846 RepID=A0AAV4V1Z0_CAEEX|nr:hypothetical protein CEXT_14641 [Caerostris extrusa]
MCDISAFPVHCSKFFFRILIFNPLHNLDILGFQLHGDLYLPDTYILGYETSNEYDVASPVNVRKCQDSLKCLVARSSSLSGYGPFITMMANHIVCRSPCFWVFIFVTEKTSDSEREAAAAEWLVDASLGLPSLQLPRKD